MLLQLLVTWNHVINSPFTTLQQNWLVMIDFLVANWDKSIAKTVCHWFCYQFCRSHIPWLQFFLQGKLYTKSDLATCWPFCDRKFGCKYPKFATKKIDNLWPKLIWTWKRHSFICFLVANLDADKSVAKFANSIS